MTKEQERASEFFYPPPKTICTSAFSRFLTEYHENLDSFMFVIHVVAKADETRVAAAKALLPLAQTDTERDKYQTTVENKDLILKQLARHSRVQSQNLTNGAVNAFQRFFSGLVQSVALKRPETIASSAHVRIEDVVKFRSRTKLIEFLVDKKVNELAYGGLQDMDRFFVERLGIAMFHDELERSLLRIFIEARNINVHNGGIVNSTFVSRVRNVDGFIYSPGKHFHVDFDNLTRLSENAMRVAMRLDRDVAAKFRMQTKSHSAWTKKK